VLLSHYEKDIHRFRFPLSVVEQPFLWNLSQYFAVSFTIVHANIIGSHGYLDVRLEPAPNATGVSDPDSPGKLISLARRLGIVVRRVSDKDFWDDLELDLEEEIRRALAHALSQENWLHLEPELDVYVKDTLSEMKRQYLIVPDHVSLEKWLKDFVDAKQRKTFAPPTGVMWDIVQVAVAGLAHYHHRRITKDRKDKYK
jgi:hypothetical protein